MLALLSKISYIVRMATMIDVSDSRTAKALEILTTAQQWAKVTTRSGQKFYGVPSQKDPTRRYLTNCYSCDCPDQQRHASTGRCCKHIIACRLYVATVRAHGSRGN
jgi:SWIM zinc finger